MARAGKKGEEGALDPDPCFSFVLRSLDEVFLYAGGLLDEIGAVAGDPSFYTL